MELLKNKEFILIRKNVKPDVSNRIVLPDSVVKIGVVYDMYQNKFGQIILNPR